jgi:hypothetical protein
VHTASQKQVLLQVCFFVFKQRRFLAQIVPSKVADVCEKRKYLDIKLRVPERESSWNDFIRNPSGNGDPVLQA